MRDLVGATRTDGPHCFFNVLKSLENDVRIIKMIIYGFQLVDFLTTCHGLNLDLFLSDRI